MASIDSRFKAKHGLDNNNERITNVADPTANTDAANKQYVDPAFLTPVSVNGGQQLSLRGINFIEGANVSIDIAPDGLNQQVNITINAGGAGGNTPSGNVTYVSSSQNVEFEIAQVGHGFSQGEVIYHNGTTYERAIANSANSLGLMVVSRIANTNYFHAATIGLVDFANANAGVYYYVSNTVAGAVTTQEQLPFSNPIMFGLPNNKALVLNYRPSQLDAIINAVTANVSYHTDYYVNSVYVGTQPIMNLIAGDGIEIEGSDNSFGVDILIKQIAVPSNFDLGYLFAPDIIDLEAGTTFLEADRTIDYGYIS
jgi:hypothetical protein